MIVLRTDAGVTAALVVYVEVCESLRRTVRILFPIKFIRLRTIQFDERVSIFASLTASRTA